MTSDEAPSTTTVDDTTPTSTPTPTATTTSDSTPTSESPTTTSDSIPTSESPTTTSDSTPDSTETTTAATWSKPSPPTRPTEEKLEDRITSVKFINKATAESGAGYSNFDVQVNADTVMKNVDPEGDVQGEPYFIVEVNDKLVARASVTFEKNGSFAIEIPSAALQQFDSGTLDVRVSLLDEDSHSDDLYDTWSGTIEYSSS